MDTRSGSGYQVLRRWRFQGGDGGSYEVVIVASTLLPVQPGPLPQRYAVAWGSPFGARHGWPDGAHLVGEYSVLQEAEKAAEDFIQRKKNDRTGP